MVEYDKVRDAQGQVIAIVNRQALQMWLRFGTTDPSFSTLAACLRHVKQANPGERQLVSVPSTKFAGEAGD